MRQDSTAIRHCSTAARFAAVKNYLFALSLFVFTSCSPAYVFRAGWEEAKILLGRKPLDELIDSSDTAANHKEKFRLVNDARKFSETLGLKPNNSFTQYSHIDRDVLVWVVSASPKTTFEPVTWWFPIVGRVPYKGFFEKEDAIAEVKKLHSKGYDVYLRPSAAFSTLGWFDDPLLSTVLKFDEVSLVNTVIHEIVHNTVWVKDNVHFNETLANFLANVSTEQFFGTRDDKYRAFQSAAENQSHDDLLFASYLSALRLELEALYAKNLPVGDEIADPKVLSTSDILSERELIFKKARPTWESLKARFKGPNYKNLPLPENNAAIIAYWIYLKDINLFADLYRATNYSVPKFLKEIKLIQEISRQERRDSYLVMQEQLNGEG